MRAGVTVVDPATTWIDSTVTLGTGRHAPARTPNCTATTHIAADAVVGPDTTLKNVTVGEGATVARTHGSGSVIGPGATRRPLYLPASRHRAG